MADHSEAASKKAGIDREKGAGSGYPLEAVGFPVGELLNKDLGRLTFMASPTVIKRFSCSWCAGSNPFVHYQALPARLHPAIIPRHWISALDNASKGMIGEAWAKEAASKFLKDATIISKPVEVGEHGIDLVIKLKDGRYIIGESKFGKGKLGMTKTGRQASREWILSPAKKGDPSRLIIAVDEQEASLIMAAFQEGKVETWLMRSNARGDLSIVLLGENGKPLPEAQQVSEILKAYGNLHES